MDNPPILTEQQADKQNIEGRTSFDTYILLAVSTVLILAAIAQLVLHLNGDTGLLSFVTVLFILAGLCCVAVAAWRATVVTQPFAGRRSVSMSAAFGSFLSGLFTVVFADDTAASALLLIIGVCLAIVALCVVCIVILFIKEEQTKRHVEPPARGLPVDTDAYGREKRMRETTNGFSSRSGASAEPSPLPSGYAPPKYRERVQAQGSAMNSFPPGREPRNQASPPLPIAPQPSKGALNIMPTEVSGLHSLFEGDELYAFPQNTKARLFILTKSNDIPDNCEDACAISNDETRFAVCDGVSASKFARPWARLLALEWVAHPLAAYDADTLDAWLERPRSRWLEWVNNTWFFKINERNRSMGRVEFSESELKKFTAQGAAATFLGLHIDRVASTWTAVAVGDTCLFHFYFSEASTRAYKCFPLTQSSEFTDSPAYVTTRPQSVALAASHLVSTSRAYREGDLLVMATDALAKWLLERLEDRQIESIVSLLSILEKGSNEMFARFVDDERAKKQLVDDDTTLIIIHV